MPKFTKKNLEFDYLNAGCDGFIIFKVIVVLVEFLPVLVFVAAIIFAIIK